MMKKKPKQTPPGTTEPKEAQAKREASRAPNREDVHEQREPDQKREGTVKKR